jgi:HD-like signal output (HDOD) protein
MKLTSLQQAVARLGLQNIADIAMAATMGPRLFAAPEFKPLVDQLWRESLANACWSREIARHLRQNVEAAFLSGLLCQIGKPVVLQALVSIASKQSVDLQLSVLVELLNTYHARVGVELSKVWRLPDAVTQCMAALSGQDVDSHFEDIIAAVRAAKVVAEKIALPEFENQLLYALPELMAANLYPEDIDDLLKKSSAIHSMLEAMTL